MRAGRIVALVVILGGCARAPRPASSPARTEPATETATPVEAAPSVEDLAAQIAEAERLWALAEETADPASWEAAALAYDALAELEALSESSRREASTATVAAWKNALRVDPVVKTATEYKPDDETERPIPEREQHLIRALERHIGYLTYDNDERMSDTFLIARLYSRYHHHDAAIPLYVEIVRTRPDHEVGLYAANLLIDTLNRLGRYDEMIKWADAMLADPRMIDDRDELVERLRMIQQRAIELGYRRP